MHVICKWVGFVVCAVALPLGADVIELANGSRIEGTIVYSKTDSVLVELGFTVLDVPRDAIVAIVDDERAANLAEAEAGTLFNVALEREGMTVEDNLDRVGEAVVQVRTPVSLGSGFMIHSDGYVVTNQHVVSGEHRLTVSVWRQTEHELERLDFSDVRIVAMSPRADLALLKIQDAGAGPFVTVPLAEEKELRQGQTVFAVGSPLGLDRSVARGIISLTDRVLDGALYIQTTTAINPGNSGGPLFNLRGEVVGVNNLKLAGVGLEGLSFAIPVATVRAFITNRSAFAFDPRNPNAGFRYHVPPGTEDAS
jgi:serine protease Do